MFAAIRRAFGASTSAEIEAAFDRIAELRPDALLIGTDPFFVAQQREAIVARAGRAKFPTIYPFREYAAVGGLMSYGANIANSYASPAELPVMQPTTFELVINLKTAAAMNIDIPATLHARSNEVIE